MGLIVLTEEQLQEVVEIYSNAPGFAWDIETWGPHRLDPRRNDALWISFATEGHSCTIPMGHPNGEFIRFDKPLLAEGVRRRAKGLPERDSDFSKDEKKWVPIFGPPPEQLTPAVVMKALRPVLFGPALKVAQNEKFDLKSMAKYYGGRLPSGPYWDTMNGSKVLNATKTLDHSLAGLVKRELGRTMVKGVGKEVEKHSFSEVAEYSLLDSEAAWDVAKSLILKIEATGRLEQIMALEMDVLPVVCMMELTGADMDVDTLRDLDKRLREDIEVAKGDMYKRAGRPFNPNSNPEKQKLLFLPKSEGGRGLKPNTRSKAALTPKGLTIKREGGELDISHYSVSADALRALSGKDDLLDAMLVYADLNKLLSTYVTPYYGGEVVKTTNGKSRIEVRESMLVNGKVHGSFNQIGADTGRFSSSEPNLQNIPRPNKDDPKDYGTLIRSLFIAPPGKRLVQADYSQIEPRIIASLSGDPVMVQNYLDGGDIYTAIGDRMGVERQAGKTLVLATAYGVGSDKIAQDVGCSIKEADDLLGGFYRTFPLIGKLKSRTIRVARSQKPTPFVETVFGRRRYLPDLKSELFGLRARAERQAFNTLVQGCLPSDTCVLTEDGWTPIGNFKDGSNVWTGERWASATRLSMGPSRRLRLYLSDGRTFDCDERHRLLVQDGAWPRWADMNEIVGLPLVRDAGSEWGRSDGAVDDWYWLGRMIGDGHTSSEGTRQRGWSLAFGPDEARDRDRFCEWLDRNVESFKGGTNSKTGYCSSLYENSSQVFGGTKVGHDYWTSRGVVGGAYGKRIPAAVFTQDKARRIAFLLGYSDADGHVKDRAWKITSVNRPLLKDTIRLLQTLGLSGSLSSPMVNGAGQAWYDLYIHKGVAPLFVEDIEVFDEEPMFTLSVDDERHAFSSEGLISKNTAADVMKVALVRAYSCFEDEPEVQIILTVHDEMVVITPEELAEDVAEAVAESMNGVTYPGQKVPLTAEVKIAKKWSECK